MWFRQASTEVLMHRSLLYMMLFAMLGLFIQACAPKPKAETPCGFVTNSYGQRVSWKGDVPIPLYIHESFPDEFFPAIEDAIKKWEAEAGRPLFKVVSWSYNGTVDPRRDGLNVIYWMNTWESQKYQEQARTSIYWEGNQLREADLRINDFNFNFYIDSLRVGSEVHLPSLIIHELGHVLGLAHNDSNTSVMNTYLASQTSRTSLSESDNASLKCEY